MWTVIKLAALVLTIYAVVTATPADRIAMAQGADAFRRSLTGACTREHSPCTALLALIGTLRPAASSEATLPADPDRRPFDHSLRQKSIW